MKHLRRKRIYAVLIIAALIGALQLIVPVIYGLGFPSQATLWAYSFFSFTNFLVIIVGTFFAGDAIASEFELRTGYIIFPNPISRLLLILGKFTAALFSALLAIGFYYAIGVGGLLGIYGFVPLEIAASFAYAVLAICVVLGFTFLFSSIMKGSMGATLLSFFMFLLILSTLRQVIALTGTEPWFMPDYAFGSIIQVINPQQDIIQEFPGSPIKIYNFYPKFPVDVAVLISYFVATLALSIWVFRKKEMA
ncbi:ABC transporter permease [Candidatus Bathyarchaeota archaeon]|nr:ABC transporter permease [Candidatus Bathyarchaeota archaeon]